MDIDTWWGIIESARAAAGDRADDRDQPDDPLVRLLAERVAARPPVGIIDFGRRLAEIRRTAYTQPLWGAAYLIEAGCGDDGFMDFRAGLILLGRDWYERAVADPDSLADHPTVIRMATEDQGWIGCEDMNYVARSTYSGQVGDSAVFDAAMSASTVVGGGLEPTGTGWDVDDSEQNRERLPRLTELFG